MDSRGDLPDLRREPETTTSGLMESQWEPETTLPKREGEVRSVLLGNAHSPFVTIMSKRTPNREITTDSRDELQTPRETKENSHSVDSRARGGKKRKSQRRLKYNCIQWQLRDLSISNEMATWDGNTDARQNGEPAQEPALSDSLEAWLEQAAEDILRRASTPQEPERNETGSRPSDTYSPISSVSDDVVIMDVQRPPSPPVSVPPTPVVYLSQPTWKIYTAGFLWRVFHHFQTQGHVGMQPTDMPLIRNLVPPSGLPMDIMPIVLCMVHTLASQEGVEEVLRDWYRREGRMQTLHVANGHQLAPRLTPWVEGQVWSYGTWSLSTMLLTRFLSQPPGIREEQFLESLTDVFASANHEGWIVEILTATLFFVKNSAWVWPFFFDPNSKDGDKLRKRDMNAF